MNHTIIRITDIVNADEKQRQEGKNGEKSLHGKRVEIIKHIFAQK